MSVERRIDTMSYQQFAELAERLKREHGVDEALAQWIWSELSPGARAVTRVADILDRVRREVDPALVDFLYEKKIKARTSVKTE